MKNRARKGSWPLRNSTILLNKLSKTDFHYKVILMPTDNPLHGSHFKINLNNHHHGYPDAGQAKPAYTHCIALTNRVGAKKSRKCNSTYKLFLNAIKTNNPHC